MDKLKKIRAASCKEKQSRVKFKINNKTKQTKKQTQIP